MVIVCLTQGEIAADVFTVERCTDGCSLCVGKVGKVTFDSCSMGLIDGRFGGGRGRNGEFWIVLTIILVPWSPLRA